MADESVRDFRHSDAEACVVAMRSNVPEFFLPSEVADFVGFLAQGAGRYLVIDDVELGVAACGGYHVDDCSGMARLAWGMVHRSRHGQGLGTVLLQERLRRIADEGVARHVVLDTSQLSRTFFVRFGFVTTSTVPDGYGPGLDRYDMRLALPST